MWTFRHVMEQTCFYCSWMCMCWADVKYSRFMWFWLKGVKHQMDLLLFLIMIIKMCSVETFYRQTCLDVCDVLNLNYNCKYSLSLIKKYFMFHINWFVVKSRRFFPMKTSHILSDQQSDSAEWKLNRIDQWIRQQHQDHKFSCTELNYEPNNTETNWTEQNSNRSVVLLTFKLTLTSLLSNETWRILQFRTTMSRTSAWNSRQLWWQ